jgi:hypothetical protein
MFEKLFRSAFDLMFHFLWLMGLQLPLIDFPCLVKQPWLLAQGKGVAS